jgi:hypothetical protein
VDIELSKGGSPGKTVFVFSLSYDVIVARQTKKL